MSSIKGCLLKEMSESLAQRSESGGSKPKRGTSSTGAKGLPGRLDRKE